jgi:hypothetical protein
MLEDRQSSNQLWKSTGKEIMTMPNTSILPTKIQAKHGKYEPYMNLSSTSTTSETDNGGTPSETSQEISSPGGI